MMPVARFSHRLKRDAAITLAWLALLMAWDASALDMALARWVGSSEHGFAWRDSWWLNTVLHDGARRLSWLVMLALSLAVWWPMGVLAQIRTARRFQLAGSALLAALVVTALKGVSHTSCPWDLHDFGGVARYISHWQSWTATDGGSGGCFPAGHAASGFAFISGYFAFRRTHGHIAHLWLTAALVSGLLLGVAQQLRGAHFMSHTLWTGWLCWATASAIDAAWPHSDRPSWAHEATP